MSEKMTASNLARKTCKPCSEETPPLEGGRLREFAAQLSDDWRVVSEHHLERDFAFDDFQQALEFTNRIGEIAEKENHHPDIFLTWGKVGLKIWTHNIDGLSESDFILAAKLDEVR